MIEHTCASWEGPVLWAATVDGREWVGEESQIERAIADAMHRGIDVKTLRLWGVEKTETEGEFFYKLIGLQEYLEVAWPEALRGEKKPCFED